MHIKIDLYKDVYSSFTGSFPGPPHAWELVAGSARHGAGAKLGSEGICKEQSLQCLLRCQWEGKPLATLQEVVAADKLRKF